MRTFEQRRFHHHTVEAGRVRPAEPGGVRMVREAEDRDVREPVGDVVRIDPCNVGDYEIGRLDTVGGLEAVLREERLELAPEEEVDPCEQDRSHA